VPHRLIAANGTEENHPEKGRINEVTFLIPLEFG